MGTGQRPAFLATLDSNGRLGAWRPLDLKVGVNGFVGYMSWSPDSTQIAYTSALDDAGQPGSAVRVRNIVSGEDRESLECTASGRFGPPLFGTAQTGEASRWHWIPVAPSG